MNLYFGKTLYHWQASYSSKYQIKCESIYWQIFKTNWEEQNVTFQEELRRETINVGISVSIALLGTRKGNWSMCHLSANQIDWQWINSSVTPAYGSSLRQVLRVLRTLSTCYKRISELSRKMFRSLDRELSDRIKWRGTTRLLCSVGKNYKPKTLTSHLVFHCSFFTWSIAFCFLYRWLRPYFKLSAGNIIIFRFKIKIYIIQSIIFKQPENLLIWEPQ